MSTRIGNKSYREMAKEAGLSVGAVNWIVNDLKSLGHLVDFDARGRRRGLLIDLVPFGGLEEVRGQISWPPDFSIVMSTVGFREAYDNSIEVRIANHLIVKLHPCPDLR